MTVKATGKPRITVLNADGDTPLPGLDELSDSASIEQVWEREQLAALLPQTDILVVTDFRTGLLQQLWPREHEIQWVHAASAGVDALTFEPLWSSPIAITNARGVFDRGIAEYVLGAVLLLAKDSLGNLRHQREHRWVHRETPLIRDQRVLVVGAGSIGREVAGLLHAVGMKVTGVARSARHDPPFDAVHAEKDLPTLLPDVDYVVITAPLTDQTRGLFDTDLFACMRPGVYLINVGRGPIVRAEALLDALQRGQVAGAALDVFEQEPLPPEHPLWEIPQVMLSAHMAGDFVGWRRALGQQFARNFRRWQHGEALDNRIER